MLSIAHSANFSTVNGDFKCGGGYKQSARPDDYEAASVLRV